MDTVGRSRPGVRKQHVAKSSARRAKVRPRLRPRSRANRERYYPADLLSGARVRDPAQFVISRAERSASRKQRIWRAVETRDKRDDYIAGLCNEKARDVAWSTAPLKRTKKSSDRPSRLSPLAGWLAKMRSVPADCVVPIYTSPEAVSYTH